MSYAALRRPAVSTVATALDLAAHGFRIAPAWPVLRDPLDGALRCSCPAGHDCTRPGKHCWFSRSWYVLASSEPTTIVPWFRLRPSAILLLMGGPTRTIALDVDGPDGEQSLAQLEGDLGELPATLTQLTGRGRHLLMTVPVHLDIDRIRNRVAVAAGIDVRAERGYIRVGGLHVSGAEYRWDNPKTPIAKLPDAWHERLVSRSTRSTVALQTAAIDRPHDRHLPSIEERVDRARRYIERRPAAIAGQRGHDALWTVTLDLVRRFVVPPETAIQILDEEYSPRCTPGWSDVETMHKVESALGAIEVGWAGLCGFVADYVDDAGDILGSTIDESCVGHERADGYKGGEPGVGAATDAESADDERLVLGDEPDPVRYCSARIARVAPASPERLDVHLVITDAPYARLPLLLPVTTSERRSRLALATGLDVRALDEPHVLVAARLRVEVIRRDGRLRIGRMYPPSGAH